VVAVRGGVAIKGEEQITMDVICPHCGYAQKVGEGIFGDHEKIDIGCRACGIIFQIVSPKLGTFRSHTTRQNVTPVTQEMSVDGRLLRLPENLELSLKVLEGSEKGTVYPVIKPRITIGRTNADINIQDALSSRIHCAIEISGELIQLRDLDSTNGTFVGDQRIKTVALSNGSTFRIGGHSFQLVIIPPGV
jgi:pSer/pThr/pTyr-binding forkhead associated (FHA) protein